VSGLHGSARSQHQALGKVFSCVLLRLLSLSSADVMADHALPNALFDPHRFM